MSQVRVGLVQMTCGPDPALNLEKAIGRVREAAAKGARIGSPGSGGPSSELTIASSYVVSATLALPSARGASATATSANRGSGSGV